jgi:hypothetical protein
LPFCALKIQLLKIIFFIFFSYIVTLFSQIRLLFHNFLIVTNTMRDFSSFQAFTISENQAAAIEGGVDATTTSTTVPATTPTIPTLPTQSKDGKATAIAKLGTVKLPTQASTNAQAKVKSVHAANIARLKA